MVISVRPRSLREIDSGVDQELLCKIDDGAVRSADVLAGAPLRSKTRNDLDDEIDLVREQGVQVDETVARQLGELDVSS